MVDVCLPYPILVTQNELKEPIWINTTLRVSDLALVIFVRL